MSCILDVTNIGSVSQVDAMARSARGSGHSESVAAAAHRARDARKAQRARSLDTAALQIVDAHLDLWLRTVAALAPIEQG